mmetsp:Transcript_32409/g.60917  ORF Transcript_32409/g.60917 Transcript_32409/m.60917 type:complete len:128 (+) Transcript_32409:200-583(+)|eukprot:CAMPEP_0114244456 /NCGR_PEP_ID=MMETSP0058-20121206/11346_1 /TAXON_ID=36894 /ORGANISM="Pyramimonas parkeae, CCMP726" /LENGTH=127 /DNA_ID=CAMNT_0001357391 /DNA_START=112 /DNA_END=495 /DNA_ORIENTATION=-
MSWKKGHGNRNNLSNRANIDPESGHLYRREDDDLDAEILGLRGKISMLKKVSSEIGQEVDLRHRLILDLEDIISKASTSVKKTMRTVTKLYNESSGNKHMYILLLFVFLVFLVVYSWKKMSKMLGIR